MDFLSYKHTIFYYIIIAASLLRPQLLYAQPTPTKGKVTTTSAYRHFTNKDGLPQIQITNIFEDSEGYVWIGTKFGITRWDGNSFYTPKYPNTNMMSQIGEISEFNKGEIVSTNYLYPHLNVMNGNQIYKKIFPSIPENCYLETIRKNTDSTAILYFYSTNQSLDLGSFVLYDFVSKRVLGVHKTSKIQLIEAKNDTLIYLKQIKNNLVIFKSKNFVPIDSITADVLNFTDFRDNLMRPNHTKLNGTIKYSILQSTSKLKNTISYLKVLEEDNVIVNFLRLNNEFYYTNRKNEFCKVTNGRKEILVSNIPLLTSLCVSKNGSIWAGTEQGVYCIYNDYINEIKLNCNEGTLDNVWSIAKCKDQYFYISYRTGIISSKENNNSWEKESYYYEHKFACDRQYHNPSIAGLGAFTTQKGGVILPYAGGLFYIYNGKKSNITSNLIPTEVTKFIQKTNGEIIGSSYYTTFLFDENKLKVDSLFSLSQIGLESITNIDIDRDDNLCVMNKRGFKIYKNNKWQFIAKYAISSSAIDNQNNYWMIGKGKFYLYAKNKLETINEKFFPYVSGDMKIFNNQWMVISNNTDIILFNYAEYLKSKKIIYRRIDNKNGFDVLEGGQNSMLLDNTDSSIIWACSDKIVQFYPNQYINAKVNNKIKITNIIAYNNNEKQNYIDSLGAIIKHIDKKYRNIKIEFTTPQKLFNTDLQFRYRLNSDEWQYTYEHYVTADQLSPKKYNLEIQTSIDACKWSDSTIVTFIISPYWYETLLGKAILFLTVLGVLYFIILVVSRKIAKQKITNLNNKLNIEILKNENLNLTLINTKSKFIPHFSGNILNAITYFFEVGESKKGIDYLSKFTELNKQILLGADNSSNDLETEISFLKHYIDLELLRFEGDIIFNLDIDADVDSSIKVPTLILHTFCENAIKHGIMSKNGKGNLKVKIENYQIEYIKITIEDDGIGREEAAKINLETTGQGLNILRRQVELYNLINTQKISIAIEDVVKNMKVKGTIVVVIIPKNYKYNSKHE